MSNFSLESKYKREKEVDVTGESFVRKLMLLVKTTPSKEVDVTGEGENYSF